MTGTPVPYRIVTTPVGILGVEINGDDVTDQTVAFAVEARQGQPTIVTLERIEGGVIEGDAIVQVAGTAGGGDAVRALDPEQVKERAMQGASMGTNVAARYIATIAAMLDERSG